MAWQSIACLAVALRGVNLRITDATAAAYRPVCNLPHVEAVSLMRRDSDLVKHHVVARVRFVDGSDMVCSGYGCTLARAHDDAAVKSCLRAATSWTCNEP